MVGVVTQIILDNGPTNATDLSTQPALLQTLLARAIHGLVFGFSATSQPSQFETVPTNAITLANNDPVKSLRYIVIESTRK